MWRFVLYLFLLVPLLFSLLNFVPLPPLWWKELNLVFANYYLFHHLLAIIVLVFYWPKTRQVLSKISLILCLLVASLYWLQLKKFFFYEHKIKVQQQLPLSAKATKLKVGLLRLDRELSQQAVEQLVLDPSIDLLALTGLATNFIVPNLLQQRFQHKFVSLSGAENLGLAIFSNIPLTLSGNGHLGEDLPRVLEVDLNLVTGSSLRLLLLNAPFPNSQQSYHQAKLLVRRSSTKYRHTKEDLLILASLNTTANSYSYGRLRKATNATDAMWGFGLWRTWNSNNFVLRFAFDHVLYRGKMLAESYENFEIHGQEGRLVVVGLVL